MKAVRCFFICLSVLLCSDQLSAQAIRGDSVYHTPISKSPGKSINYFFYLQAGLLIGCSSCDDGKDVSSSTALVNGISIKKKLRAGIGLGFDSYVGWITMPTYASLSWDVFGNKNRNAFFVQVNYGVAKAWKQSYQEYGFDKAEGGRMIYPLAGYRIKYHDLSIFLALGYKMQRVHSYYKYPTWNWVNGEFQQGTSSTTVKQDMNRLMITMALGWR